MMSEEEQRPFSLTLIKASRGANGLIFFSFLSSKVKTRNNQARVKYPFPRYSICVLYFGAKYGIFTPNHITLRLFGV